MDKRWLDERAEHERGLATTVFSNPDLLVRVGTIVSEDDFRDDFLGAIFGIASILQSAGRFTHARLRTELRKRGFLRDEAELKLFHQLKDSVTTQGDWHAAELARIVALENMQRVLSRELQAAQCLPTDPNELKSRLEAQLDAISTNQVALWERAGDLAMRVYKKHREHLDDPTSGRMGLSTGFSELDQFTGGYFPQQLWQIAARSYFGKTTVALNLVSRLVQPVTGEASGVYFASYEMSNEELQERMFAEILAIPIADFTQGKVGAEQLMEMTKGLPVFESLPLLFDEHPPATVAALAARVKLAMQEMPIRVLVVDHLQQIPLPRHTKRHEFLAQAARDFKRLAKDLGITVILLNQLNAAAEEADEPTNLHFSEGKQVLESLDVSLLLHRKDESDQKMKVIISKNKKGAKASFFLRFVGSHQRVEDWHDEF